jgi:hypothetical protein
MQPARPHDHIADDLVNILGQLLQNITWQTVYKHSSVNHGIKLLFAQVIRR